MSEYVISPMTAPVSLEDADAADFIAACEVINRATEGVLGTQDFSLAPDERLPYALDPDNVHAEFVAKVGNAGGAEVVGWGGYLAQRGDDVKECWLEVHVDEGHRREGIGSALLEVLVGVAREQGKTELIGRAFTRDDAAGPALEAGSGFGSVQAGDSAAAFAVAHGFALEQVGQINRLGLPVEPDLFAERVAVARDGFGEDYELLHWSGPTPEEHLAGIGRLFTEMSTAAPHAGLEISEDVWDADRVREADERERTSPRTKLTAAAREIASGDLVAFTTLDVPPDLDRAVNQWATLVSAAHRGRRLGLAVKLENLQQLMDDFPGHPSVITVNAEENGYMISVNRSVGFVAVGRGGMFRRVLG